MKEKFKENLNVIIFSIVNFFVGLVCLLVIKNPVPISIGKNFIVGELGSKWILLLFLFMGLILGGVGLIGKQETPQQAMFARKRQIGINILISIWTVIIYFFLCLFTSMDIIGSRVRLNIASMIVCVIACILSLFSKNFFAKKENDMYLNYNLSLTIFVSEICGYILLIVAAVNIFVDNLIFIFSFVFASGAAIYLLPWLCVMRLKKIHRKQQSLAAEEVALSDEKILSAVNFASDISAVKENPKPARKKKDKEESNISKIALKEEEAKARKEQKANRGKRVPASKTQAKKLAKQNQTKNAQKASGNKTSNRSTTHNKAKTTVKKQIKTSSNYKGTSKTKNIKK